MTEFLKVFSAWIDSITHRPVVQHGGKSEGIRQSGKFTDISDAIRTAKERGDGTFVADIRKPPYKEGD